MKYTELELKVIETFGAFMNYETLEANLSDNCTCLSAREISEMTGLDVKTVKGVLGSLEKKNLVFVDIVNFNHKVLMVTDEGVTAYFELFKNNKEKDSKEDTTMIKAVERATGNVYSVKRIEGGFKVYDQDGNLYKKLKESTFKRYYKVTGETTEKATSKHKTEKAPEPTQELSDEKRESMIEKIRKILKLAQDNPSMEEGLAAALQAQKLMAKYNIHQEDVELEEIKDEIGSVFSEQKHDSQLHGWRKNLASIIAKNFRCKCYMHGKDVVFRGYKEDAKIALDVYMNLYTMGNKLGSKAYHDQLAETGSGKGAYNSFVLGFLKGIEEGLGEQCTALMIIVPKEVEEEFEEFTADFKHSKGGMVFNGIDGELFNKGKKEGKAAVKARQVEKKGR